MKMYNFTYLLDSRIQPSRSDLRAFFSQVSLLSPPSDGIDTIAASKIASKCPAATTNGAIVVLRPLDAIVGTKGGG